jgi:hypothetical protein
MCTHALEGKPRDDSTSLRRSQAHLKFRNMILVIIAIVRRFGQSLLLEKIFKKAGSDPKFILFTFVVSARCYAWISRKFSV